MARTLLNFWLDVILLVSFLAGVFCLAVLRFVFPAGTVADGWRLWGLTYDGWFDLQFNLFGFVAIAAVIHVMLHWNWICGVITSRLMRGESGKRPATDTGTRTLYGVALLAGLLTLLGAAMFAAMLHVRDPLSAAAAREIRSVSARADWQPAALP